MPNVNKPLLRQRENCYLCQWDWRVCQKQFASQEHLTRHIRQQHFDATTNVVPYHLKFQRYHPEMLHNAAPTENPNRVAGPVETYLRTLKRSAESYSHHVIANPPRAVKLICREAFQSDFVVPSSPGRWSLSYGYDDGNVGCYSCRLDLLAPANIRRWCENTMDILDQIEEHSVSGWRCCPELVKLVMK